MKESKHKFESLPKPRVKSKLSTKVIIRNSQEFEKLGSEMLVDRYFNHEEASSRAVSRLAGFFYNS